MSIGDRHAEYELVITRRVREEIEPQRYPNYGPADNGIREERALSCLVTEEEFRAIRLATLEAFSDKKDAG